MLLDKTLNVSIFSYAVKMRALKLCHNNLCQTLLVHTSHDDHK